MADGRVIAARKVIEVSLVLLACPDLQAPRALQAYPESREGQACG